MSLNWNILKCPFPSFLFGTLTTTTIIYLYNKYIINNKNNKKKKFLSLLTSNSSSSSSSSLLDLHHPYKNELNIALECIYEAGENLKLALKNEKLIDSKGRENDFVTETDRNNEEIIFKKLRQHFPHHKFIGEETSSVSGLPELTDEPTWIVDPVDGTTNFIHRNPLTCVSIGLAINKIPVLGVVYSPCSGDELFVAIRGHGAYLNGERIHVSGSQTIGDSIVLTEFGYERTTQGIQTICSTLQNVILAGPHAIRSLGSGVLDLCYLATGRLDAVYAGVAGESWCPWDYCAGWVIIEEAGGILMTLDHENRQFYMYSKSILAASSLQLGNELYEIVKKK